MSGNISISPEMQKQVSDHLKNDPVAKEIADKELLLHQKKNELIELEGELSILKKKRPEIDLRYRESINWCLTIDSENPYYFLKSKEGLVRCVEYKHKYKLTQGQNSAFGAVLSTLFKENKVGRITPEHMDVFFYGLPEMFDEDKNGQLTILKKKYQKNVHKLRHVNVKF
ncbi:hypothetical protein [Terrimonas ferruginea]|uniref:hypothetical protein n=1 Tax=Terrimonas ferruginea TaxID=249 RepID=UPI00048AE868|nr:hypothetical protein [Terrimonas ferruginea]